MTRAVLALAAAVLVALVLRVPPAAATTCSSPPPRAALDAAVAVAYVRVVETSAADLRAGGWIRAQVERVFKGELRPVIVVNVEESLLSIGYPQATPGSDHTLYLRMEPLSRPSPPPSEAALPGALFTSLCFGSHPGPPTAEEDLVLGSGQAPKGGSADPLVLGGLVALGVVIVLLWFRARLSWQRATSVR